MFKGQAERRRLPRVKLCSAKAGIKAIHKGGQACIMILCAPDTVCPQGVDSMQGNGTIVHDQSNNPALASKWQALLTEYTGVFENPEKLVSRLIDHCINQADPNVVPLKLQLYQISEDEFRVVKDTIDDCLAYGWIRPSSSNSGAPIIIICKKTEGLHIVIDY